MARSRALSGGAGFAVRPAPRPRPQWQLRYGHHLVGWGFAAPWVVIFVVFLAIPIVASLVLSFTNFGLADIRNPLGTSVVGLKNYENLFADPKFWQAAFNTAFFVVVGVPLTLLAGLGAALALNQ